MKILKKLVLAIVVLFLLIGFIFMFRKKGEVSSSSLDFKNEKSSYPKLFLSVEDEKINFLRPYKNEVLKNVSDDIISLITKERKMKFLVEGSLENIVDIYYELRNEENELIEKTKLDKNLISSNLEIEIQFKNLILEDREYYLKIEIEVLEEDKKEKIFYYTKVKLDPTNNYLNMLKLAKDFSFRNFSYESAKENTKYLETNTLLAPNSLAYVNLKSSFNMLSYNKMNLEEVGEKSINFLVYDKEIGIVRIKTLVEKTREDLEKEYYKIDEYFVFKKGEERYYILDYQRKMEELFLNSKYNFTGTRIAFGVGEKEDISHIQSEDEKYIFFILNDNLFLFDEEKKQVIKVLAKNIDEILERKSKLKFLRLDDDKLYFAEYGYFDKSSYIAKVGVLVYEYDISKNELRDLAFIESNDKEEILRENLERFIYLSSKDKFYLMNKEKIYEVDLKKDELKILMEIDFENIAFSEDFRFLAYKKDDFLYLLDMEVLENKKISISKEEYVKVEGFIENDLLVSYTKNTKDIENLDRSLEKNSTHIRIFDKDLNEIKFYQNSSYFIRDISIKEGIVKFDLTSDLYSIKSVYNDSLSLSKKKEVKDIISSYRDNNKIEITYLKTPKKYRVKDIKKTKAKVTKNPDLKYYLLDKEVKSYYEARTKRGQLKSFKGLSSAMKFLKKDNFPYIFKDAYIKYSRFNQERSFVNDIDIDLYKKEKIALSSNELKDVLYFVSKGKNILAYTNKKLLIYAYDFYNISVYDYELNTRYKLGKKDATEEFFNFNNEFYIEKN